MHHYNGFSVDERDLIGNYLTLYGHMNTVVYAIFYSILCIFSTGFFPIFLLFLCSVMPQDLEIQFHIQNETKKPFFMYSRCVLCRKKSELINAAFIKPKIASSCISITILFC